MNNSTQVYSGNCSQLASRTSFGEYVQTLNTTTGFQNSILEACKGEICNALWGNGNSDVSGIGMLVGYFLESILGFLLAIGILLLRYYPDLMSSPVQNKIWVDIRKNFIECTGYFSASVQIASAIVLIRKDFGISATGFGGFTVQITWAVAIVSILPLTYPLLILEAKKMKRGNFRLFMFCASWLPFCYTFISQLIDKYAPEQIGIGAGPGGTTIVTNEEWGALNHLCLSDIGWLSEVEQNLLDAFGTASSTYVLTYGLLSLLWLIADKQWPDKTDGLRRIIPRIVKEHRNSMLLWTSVFLIPILTIPQLWGIVRLRGVQRDLADTSGSTYADNQWSFGQVTAAMLFAPVFVESGHSIIKGIRRKSAEKASRV